MNTDVMFSSVKQDWETPRELFDLWNEEFNFTLDPCASSKNAKCKKFYTEEQNGLRKKWDGHTVFVNPPYSECGKWIEKSFKEAQKGSLVVMLIPARTDTKAFHKYILPFSGIISSNPKNCYIAGIIDGEGCIRIDKNFPTNKNKLARHTYNLCVSVKMLDKKTVQLLKSYFRCGSICVEKRVGKRELYRWEVRGENAKRCIEEVYPYMITKKQQAFMGIKFQIFKNEISKLKDKNSESNLEKQEFMYKRMSEVKWQKIEDVRLNYVDIQIRFLSSRIKFVGAKHSAPFPSMLVIFKKREDDESGSR